MEEIQKPASHFTAELLKNDPIYCNKFEAELFRQSTGDAFLK